METTATSLGIISKPLHVKITQTLAVTGSACLAGQIAIASYIFIPTLMQSSSPKVLTQLWKIWYDKSIAYVPASMLGVTTAFGWMAWREPSTSSLSFRLYTAAATLPVAIIPYTLLTMLPTNNALLDKEKELSVTNESAVVAMNLFSKKFTSNKVRTLTREVQEAADPSKTKPTSFTQFLSSITKKNAPEPKDLTAHELVDRWSWLNKGRSCIVLVGALCGAFAVCNEDLSFFELF